MFAAIIRPFNLYLFIYFPPASLSVSQSLGKATHAGSRCEAAGWQAAGETARSRKSWSEVQKGWSGNRGGGSEKCNSCESTGGSPAVKNKIKRRERRREEKSEWEGRMCLTAGTCVGVVGDPAGPPGNLQVCARRGPLQVDAAVAARRCCCFSQRKETHALF